MNNIYYNKSLKAVFYTKYTYIHIAKEYVPYDSKCSRQGYIKYKSINDATVYM